jgi:hypothetical protein
MARYKVYMRSVASTHVEVEADSVDAAVDAAYEAEMPHICAMCAGMGYSRRPSLDLDDKWDVSEDPDGTPMVEKLGE